MNSKAMKITLDGVLVKFDPFTRRVYWMSDWTRADDLLILEWRNGHGDPYSQDAIFRVNSHHLGTDRVTPA